MKTEILAVYFSCALLASAFHVHQQPTDGCHQCYCHDELDSLQSQIETNQESADANQEQNLEQFRQLNGKLQQVEEEQHDHYTNDQTQIEALQKENSELNSKVTSLQQEVQSLKSNPVSPFQSCESITCTQSNQMYCYCPGGKTSISCGWNSVTYADIYPSQVQNLGNGCYVSGTNVNGNGMNIDVIYVYCC